MHMHTHAYTYIHIPAGTLMPRIENTKRVGKPCAHWLLETCQEAFAAVDPNTPFLYLQFKPHDDSGDFGAAETPAISDT